MCGNEGTENNGTIEAHHKSGYEEKYWFDILWVCENCHKKITKAATIKARQKSFCVFKKKDTK
jgi:hypothetical protein